MESLTIQPKTEENQQEIGPAWFKQIIFEVLKDVQMSVDDLVNTAVKNDEQIIEKSKQESKFNFPMDAYKALNVTPLSNTMYADLQHIPVLRQFRGALCGFYMLYNTKQFLKAIITSENKYDQMGCLAQQQSSHYFWADYHRVLDIILACNDPKFVNRQDKKELVQKQSPMERSHLRWLLQEDSDLLNLQKQAQAQNIQLHVSFFETSIGIINLMIEAIISVNDKFNNFKNTDKQAINVMFLGVVNHWVALVAHKQSKEVDASQHVTWFLFDSSNMVHLDKHDPQGLIDVCEDRVRQKVQCGLKPSNKFITKMTIYSMFDQKYIFNKLMQASMSQDKTILLKYYTNSYIQNAMKNFHNYMEAVRPAPKEGEENQLIAPKCILFPQAMPKLGPSTSESETQKPTVNNEEVKQTTSDKLDLGFNWDTNEFEFPYKQLVTDFKYMEELKEDQYEIVYGMLITFMKGSHRPVDISNRSIRYIETMGIDSMFDEDLLLLKNWSKAFIHFDNKLKSMKDLFEMTQQEPDNYKLYTQMLDIAHKITQLLTQI